MSALPHGRWRAGGAGPASGAALVDGGVVTATAILAGIGIVMIYSATAPLALDAHLPPHVPRHLAAFALGLPLALAATRVPLTALRRGAFALWALGVILLGVTLVAGVSVNGAQRWLPVPGAGVRVQPAEIAKWATVLAVAAALCRRRDGGPPRAREIWLPGVLTALPAALLLAQPDLGNAVLLVLIAGLLAFAAGVPLGLLAAPAAAGAAGLAAYIQLRPYAFKRWVAFLDPWETAQGPGFQLVQSFVAFGHGGLFGVGLGDSRQKLFYLPEAHTDFILAVVAEEAGLAGVLVVLGAFAALLVSGARIARRARAPFAVLVAFGMTLLLTVPALVNAAVVMGLLPTKGLPLPFLSYGRSALVMSFVAVGVLLGIARREAAPPAPARGGLRRAARS